MVSFAVAAYARARVCFYENTTLSNFGFQLVQVKSLTHEQHCYTSQLRRLFWLDKNVSRVMGKNSLTPWGEQNSLTP